MLEKRKAVPLGAAFSFVRSKPELLSAGAVRRVGPIAARLRISGKAIVERARDLGDLALAGQFRSLTGHIDCHRNRAAIRILDNRNVAGRVVCLK